MSRTARILERLKGRSVARPRTKEVDLTDPRGQLGAYLRHWIDTKGRGDVKAVADATGVSPRAVTKWCEGESAPDLLKLDVLAKHLGFDDWSKLAVAAVKFSR
jgi:transcriptional regulator with XRE-family HTH domain